MSSLAIRNGKYVSFTYTIKDIAGEILEHSGVPTSYIHGRQTEIFPQVVAALEGKVVDDNFTVPIKAAQAFGPHDESLTFTDDIENSPPELRAVGAEIDLQSEKGEVRHFVVTKIKDGRITIDCNHVLAGKDLVFAINVTGVREPTAAELEAYPLPTLY